MIWARIVSSVVVSAIAFACCVSPAAAQQAQPNLDHRKLIAESLAKLFSAEAQVRNVAVSELRRVSSPVGMLWGACVRVNPTNIAGAPRTYVVAFSRNEIAERRSAVGDDCAGAKFEPLGKS